MRFAIMLADTITIGGKSIFTFSSGGHNSIGRLL